MIRMTTTNLSTLSKPIHRKQLNELQIELLTILYKFRYGTADLISRYQEQSIRNTNVRLKNLLEQEYIGRNYDSSYRINRRPAIYFLLPDAIKLLKNNSELDPKGLHLSYYSRSAKSDFVSHCLRLFRIYLKFDGLYGGNLEFYTSSELSEQAQFPSPRPDAYLSFGSKYTNTSDCMLEVLDSTMAISRLRTKAGRYINHSEAGNWEGQYPLILLVCDNVGLEREIQHSIVRTLNYRSTSGIRYYTTTTKALFSSRSTDDTIWSPVDDSEKIIALGEF